MIRHLLPLLHFISPAQMSTYQADIFAAFKKFGRLTIFCTNAFLKGFDSELLNQSNHYIRNRIPRHFYYVSCYNKFFFVFHESDDHSNTAQENRMKNGMFISKFYD